MIILDKPLSVIVKPPLVIIMDYPSLTNFLMLHLLLQPVLPQYEHKSM